jgi:mannose-6-phosphate isomerase-like protein (cupin superfamily)
MTIYHLHGDEQGESRLTPIELTLIDAGAAGEGEGSASRVRTMPKFPAYDLGYAEMVDPLQDSGLHGAPRRQFLAILRGAYLITTSMGDEVRLEAGDCLITDDSDSKGHWSREVGDEPLAMISVGIPDDFVIPRG